MECTFVEIEVNLFCVIQMSDVSEMCLKLPFSQQCILFMD